MEGVIQVGWQKTHKKQNIVVHCGNTNDLALSLFPFVFEK